MRKLEMLVWRVVARYLKKLEEFGNQSNFQVYNKTLRTNNRTRIYSLQRCEHNFSPYSHLILTKYNHSTNNLFSLNVT